MAWFEETYHRHWRQRIEIERVIHEERTEFQDLLIFDSADFGRVLALDGIVQVTERDEFIYHEMLSHVPMMAHGEARDVLIIGGGDGGTLEEVLKHDTVACAMMVELDPAVVSRCKTHLPSVGLAGFDDPRAEVVFTDGVAFVAETEHRFDVIIVDSTDEVGPGEVLFSEAFYADCRARLRPGGILACQCGNPYGELELLRGKRARLAAVFDDVGIYTAAVPTYMGGLFAFAFASDDPARRQVTFDQLGARKMPEQLRQYSAAVHVAAFATPPWLT
ncbi:MAG: polyamine aminopropyltransferase [Pseudomonadota bacterium]